MKRNFVVVLLVVMFLIAGVVWRQRNRSQLDAAAAAATTLNTAKAERRDFVRTLRIHGIVEAVQAYMVTAPRLSGSSPTGQGTGGGGVGGGGGGTGPLVVTTLIRSGTLVKKGDLLVEFDRQGQIKAALDRQAEFLDFEQQIAKKEAEHRAARAKDEAELKQAENSAEKASLDMRKNEVISKIDAEKNRQFLEEAKANRQQLLETLELKKRAAQAELKVLEIQRDRAKAAMVYAQGNSEKMSIRAPLDGLAVVSPIWKGGRMDEVQEGEEVRPGSPILQVVNPALMQVRSRVNQADLSYLKIAQPVRVILDAYPELQFKGRLEQIAPIGIKSNFSQKMYTFISLFSIEGSDPKLIPDLSAAVDVELERIPNAVVLPRDAVAAENGQSFVRVKNGSSFESRKVDLGAVSDAEVVIQSGIEPGAVVLRHAQSREGRPS
ncbi:MAG: HlyD family efflux transporter periplasmic adaptor subunit [Acidobacteria bacterium]|nr:HlyD family efflux transporter periplasmic adaptor subunit [Acidobacteriota bacterium]